MENSNRKDHVRDAAPSSAEKLARQIWLQYFNEYLYARELITEEERQKLRRLIG